MCSGGQLGMVETSGESVILSGFWMAQYEDEFESGWIPKARVKTWYTT